MSSYDFSNVLKLGTNDETFLPAFIEKSTSELASYLACIKEGVESRNITWLNFIHHKSKPLFELLEIRQLSDTIASLTNLAHHGNWELDSKLQFLEEEIGQLIHSIETELHPKST